MLAFLPEKTDMTRILPSKNNVVPVQPFASKELAPAVRTDIALMITSTRACAPSEEDSSYLAIGCSQPIKGSRCLPGALQGELQDRYPAALLRHLAS